MSELDMIKYHKKGQLSNDCQRFLERGFSHNGYFYGCKLADQLTYMSILTKLTAVPSASRSIVCKKESTGIWISLPHDKDDIEALVSAVDSHLESGKGIYRSKCDEVDYATTRDQVNAISWSED